MIKWEQNEFAGATVHVSDSHVGYWATVPATLTDAQILAAFLASANYGDHAVTADDLRLTRLPA